MRITQSTLQKTFAVKYKNKNYYINYLNSDGQVLGLLNRDYWEITDEDGEEVDIYLLKNETKKQKEQIRKNGMLVRKLINFCIRHFNDYQPRL